MRVAFQERMGAVASCRSEHDTCPSRNIAVEYPAFAMLVHIAVFLLMVAGAVVATLRGLLVRALASLRTFETMDDIVLPPMSVIRPVRGVDPGLSANLRAALQQVYPGVIETIFVVDSRKEEAIPLIEACIREERANARVVVAGEPPPSRTGKLHAMIRGLEEARADTPLVCFADSDTRPQPTVLRVLATTLVSTPRSGAVFARTWSLEVPQTAGDAGYSFLLDAIYGPQAALAMSRDGSLPFIMGQTMVLRRDALEKSGGLEGSEGELVDDMNIGARMAARGYQNVLVDAPVAIVQSGLSWSELQDTAVRWLVYGRTGIPFWPFNAPAAIFTAIFLLGMIGATWSLLCADLLAFLCFLASSGAVVTTLSRLRREQGSSALPFRLWWAPWVCLGLVPWWFLKAHFAKHVVWRGRVYEVDDSGRLQVVPSRP